LPPHPRRPIFGASQQRLQKERKQLQALIIIGHGSHLNAESSAPVYAHAAAIRATGAFDEVRECFWKEEPSMREVFDLVEADDVYVVPLFISEGYFTEEVIPRELGLDGPAPSITRKLGKTIRYTRPVGTHPSMAGMILRRAEETAGLSDDEAHDAGLIIIGHGTERNSNSSEVIYRVSREADEAGVFGHVRTGFLDQAPEVGAVLEAMEERMIVLVPFFVAEGWHTQETIPDDLGLNRPAVSPMTEKDGRTIFYASPVGTFPEIARIVLQRAREAGARIPDGAAVGEAAGV
jgi:sirohydrochlorin cobaltochelatase